MMRRLLISVLFCLSSLSSYCAIVKTVGWAVEDASIRGEDGKIVVTLGITVSEGLLPDRGALVLMPSLESRFGEISLAPLCLYGTKAYAKELSASGDKREIRELKLKQSMRFEYTDAVPVQSWMDTLRFKLTVNRWYERLGNSMASSSRMWTFIKPRKPEKPVFAWKPLAPVKPSSVRTVCIEAPLHFENGTTKFNIEFDGNGKAMETFLHKVRRVSSTKTFSVRSSDLSVYLAPAGRSADSKKRSRQCANSLYSYLQRAGAFKQYTPARSGGGEDWEGVRGWVSRSRYGKDARVEEILMWSDTDAAAGALRSEKPGLWEEIEKQCPELLGKAVYRFDITPLTFKSPWFVEPVYDDLPETLSAFDFYYLSTAFDLGSDKWLDVLLTGATYCPDSPELNMDAAMALCQKGRAQSAVPYLRNMGDSDKARYVYGIWLFSVERYEEAIDVFQHLAGKDPWYSGILPIAESYQAWINKEGEWERTSVVL